MEDKKLIEKYRKQLVFAHCVTVAFVSFIEIIAYLVFVKCGIHELSLKSPYLWMNVVAPICVNLIAHLSVRLIGLSPKASDNFKNSSVIYGAFVTAFVVSLFHRDYIATLGAFVFPIILSAMYNDKKTFKTKPLFVCDFAHNNNGCVIF